MEVRRIPQAEGISRLITRMLGFPGCTNKKTVMAQKVNITVFDFLGRPSWIRTDDSGEWLEIWLEKLREVGLSERY